MKKVVAIIQARMGSTRLPGKVLMDIAGKPMLWHVIERVKRCKKVVSIVVATTTKEEDKAVIELAKKCGVETFAGSEEDVLDRYYQAAKKFNADIIVRITADCPLIDPEVTDKIIRYFIENFGKFDHFGPPKGYPEGLDTEVFTFQALEKAWLEAKKPSEREHVTPYIWCNPDMFKLGKLPSDLKEGEDYSHLHWSVDEECDLRFVREVYKRLYREGEIFHMRDVLNLLHEHPELLEINKGLTGYEGYMKSLKEDEEFLKKKNERARTL